MKKSNDTTIDWARLTWLQGVGACMGKPAGEIVVGDVLGWNTGATSTVVAILGETATTITVVTESRDYHGKEHQYTRRLAKRRIVATATNGAFMVANVTQADLAFRQKMARFQESIR